MLRDEGGNARAVVDSAVTKGSFAFGVCDFGHFRYFGCATEKKEAARDGLL